MYACNIDTKNSNTYTTFKNKSGKNPAHFIIITNKAITSNITCPAIIFAARRTDKLTGLIKKEKNSSIKSNGASHSGVPAGTNILKKKIPFFEITKNNVIRNVMMASVKVTDK